MFEIGFSELLLLGAIALLVLGPERLPEVAATAGRVIGKLQKWWAVTKIQMEQELHLHTLKQSSRSNVLPDIKNLIENSPIVNPLNKEVHQHSHGTNPD